jgi:hypothetical protein
MGGDFLPLEKMMHGVAEQRAGRDRSLTRAALSTGGRAKSNVLSIIPVNGMYNHSNTGGI